MVLVGSHSRLEPIARLARTIKEHREGILNYARSRVSNGILEGLNSLFKAAAAKARGYRTVRNAIIAHYLVTGRFELEAPLIDPVYSEIGPKSKIEFFKGGSK